MIDVLVAERVDSLHGRFWDTQLLVGEHLGNSQLLEDLSNFFTILHVDKDDIDVEIALFGL